MNLKFTFNDPKVTVVIACFVMACLAWGSVFYGHSVYLAALSETGRWAIGQISVGILIFWLASLPGTIFVGYLIDSKGASPVVLFGALCTSFSLIGIGSFERLWLIYVSYGLMGFAYPALGAAGISATLSPWFSKNFGWALGVALTGASVGGAIIPALLMYFINTNGFLVTMSACGTMIFVILFLISRLLACNTPCNSSSLNSSSILAGKLMEQKLFWRISLSAALALGGQVGFLAHQIPIILQQATKVEAAITVSIVAIAAAVGRLIIAYLSRTISVTKLAAISYSIQGIGIGIVCNAESYSSLVVGCAVAGTVVGAIVMLSPLIVRQAFGLQNYGKNFAAVNVVLYVFAGISPWLVGQMYDATSSYFGGLTLLITMQVLATILIFKPLKNDAISP